MNENTDNIPDLPCSEPTHILTDSECPCVSINIPCYLRRKFIPLILMNLLQMDYPHNKIEVCILQDGPEDLLPNEDLEKFKKTIYPIKLNYKYEKNLRRSIGDKRNQLVKMSTHKICACMDSDDIYMPSYLRYSISAMKEFKVGITSSAQMVFIYPKLDYKITGIRCGYKRQGHEACMIFTKKHWRSMGGFLSKGKEGNQGEGVKMIEYNDKNMVNLTVTNLMICVCHDGEEGNTINKDRFNEANMDGRLNLPHLEVLKKILEDQCPPGGIGSITY